MRIDPITVLDVALDFRRGARISVGRLLIERGVAQLEYNPAFIESGMSINPTIARPGTGLIAARDPRTFGTLHGVIADSLPDAWGEVVTRRLLARSGMSYDTLTALQRLSLVGQRGPGALVYTPEALLDKASKPIDLDTLANGAIAVLEGVPSERALSLLYELGGSSGGARPKVLLAIGADGSMRPGEGPIPVGYEAWLVKFRGRRIERDDAGAIEMAYSDLARAARIDMSPTRLFPARKGPGYFGTRRFDRVGGSRLHMASAAGLLDAEWQVPSIDYALLLQLVRVMTRDQRSVEQMFRRMVFNVLAHNRDDHAKQHAFLMDDRGTWTLAPAYDLTFAAGPGNEHYLSLDGHGGDDISTADVFSIGREQAISERDARQIIADVSEATSQFRTAAELHGVSMESIAEIESVLARGLSRFSGGSPRTRAHRR